MDAYIGQIILFAGNYEPKDWAFCDGRQLQINNNMALYSLIGTTYGGNGSTTFNLPDLRGRVAISQGQGIARAPAPQLTARVLGQNFGTETVTLQLAEIPSHQHTLQAFNAPASSPEPGGRLLAVTQGSETAYLVPPIGSNPADIELGANAVGMAGGSQPHNNRMATQTLNYLICLNGYYPPRP